MRRKLFPGSPADESGGVLIRMFTAWRDLFFAPNFWSTRNLSAERMIISCINFTPSMALTSENYVGGVLFLIDYFVFLFVFKTKPVIVAEALLDSTVSTAESWRTRTAVVLACGDQWKPVTSPVAAATGGWERLLHPREPGGSSRAEVKGVQDTTACKQAVRINEFTEPHPDLGKVKYPTYDYL